MASYLPLEPSYFSVSKAAVAKHKAQLLKDSSAAGPSGNIGLKEGG
jgi:hypothetical protein